MPIQPLPMIVPPYESIDGIETFDMPSTNVYDGYISSASFLTKRPGLEEYTNISSSNKITGIHYWEEQDLIITVSNGDIYKTDSSKVTTQIGTGVGFNTRASFASAKIGGADYLAIASGNRIQLSINGANTTQITDADAPAESTHVMFVGNRLVSNDLTVGDESKFFYSELGNPNDWSALAFVSSNGSPDQIIAIEKYWNEVVLFGTRSIEKYYLTDNPTTPFRLRSSTEQNIGTRSPSSIAFDETEQVYFFLDNKKDVMLYNLNSLTKISAPVDSVIKNLSDVSDFIGNVVAFADKRFYILSSVTNNITLVYDIFAQNWVRWGYWNKALNQYDAFLGNVSTFSTSLGYIWGSRLNNGKIFIQDPDVYSDDGNTIRCSITTGWVNMKTHLSKTFKKVIIRTKQAPSQDAYFMMNYRVNKEQGFTTNTPKTINIGGSQLKPFTQMLHNFGTGRAIQFEIVCTDDISFVFGAVEIEYTVNRI